MQLDELLAKAKALPVNQQALTNITAELNRDEPDTRRICVAIGHYPGLSERLLKLTNLACFGTAREVHTLNDAVSVLGLNRLHLLVLALAVGGCFRQVPGISLEQFWRYSLNTAKVCRALARGMGQNEGAGFAAGLMHAVGDLVLHVGAPDISARIDWSFSPYDMKRAEAERATLGYTFAEVSAAFAAQWGFPESIVRALRLQLWPFDGDDFEPLAALVHMASWRARALELRLDRAAMLASFPEAVALLLELDMERMLEHDPDGWTAVTELTPFLD